MSINPADISHEQVKTVQKILKFTSDLVHETDTHNFGDQVDYLYFAASYATAKVITANFERNERAAIEKLVDQVLDTTEFNINHLVEQLYDTKKAIYDGLKG